MKIRTHWKTALVAAAAIAISVMTAPAAFAQATGATDVDVNMPDIVILHYFSNVDVSITAAEMLTFLNGGSDLVDEGTVAPAAGGFSVDLAIPPSPLSGSDPSAAVLTLQNAWAVRAMSRVGGTQTQVSVANTDGTLDHDTTAATITVSNCVVDDGTSNGASISFPTPGIPNPQVGDVEMTLDLSNAVNAGDYLDAVFTLTAENI